MIDVVGSLIGFGLLIALMFVGLHVATVVFLSRMLGASLYLGMPSSTRLAFSYGARWRIRSFLRSRSTSWSVKFSCGAAQQTACIARCPIGSHTLPGGLLHTNIGASALFSAVSGLVCSDRCDDLHCCAACVSPPRLRSEDGARLDRGWRLARQSDPAWHRAHRLRRYDEYLSRSSLCRAQCCPAS